MANKMQKNTNEFENFLQKIKKVSYLELDQKQTDTQLEEEELARLRKRIESANKYHNLKFRTPLLNRTD